MGDVGLNRTTRIRIRTKLVRTENPLAVYKQTGRLILDDWGLAALDAQAARDVMDVIDDRAGLRSDT